jgi:hypothetical protein
MLLLKKLTKSAKKKNFAACGAVCYSDIYEKLVGACESAMAHELTCLWWWLGRARVSLGAAVTFESRRN